MHCGVWATSVAIKSIHYVKRNEFLRLIQNFYGEQFLLVTNHPNVESTFKQTPPYATSILPSTKEWRKKKTKTKTEICFPIFLRNQDKGICTSSTDRMHYPWLQKENYQLLEGRIPKVHLVRTAAARAVTLSARRQRPQLSISSVWSTSSNTWAQTGGRVLPETTLCDRAGFSAAWSSSLRFPSSLRESSITPTSF